MKLLCTNPFENSSKTETSLYLLVFSPDCPKYDRYQIHIFIGTHLCEDIKRNCPGIFSRNSSVLTPLRIRQKLELHYICYDSVPTAPNMVVTKFIYPQGPIYVEISKKLPRDIFKKFPCSNPFENSLKTRTSLYQLRFSPDCPKYGHDQIHISIGTHLCENIKRNCPVKFS